MYNKNLELIQADIDLKKAQKKDFISKGQERDKLLDSEKQINLAEAKERKAKAKQIESGAFSASGGGGISNNSSDIVKNKNKKQKL